MGRYLCIAALLGAVSLSAVSQSTQSRPLIPDWSGKWTSVTGEGVYGGPLGSVGVITQDNSTVTFTQSAGPSYDPKRSLSCRLDGSETQNTIATARGDTWMRSCQARWAGYALIVITKTTAAGRTDGFEDIAIVSLDGRGQLNIALIHTLKSTKPAMSTRVLTYKKT